MADLAGYVGLLHAPWQGLLGLSSKRVEVVCYADPGALKHLDSSIKKNTALLKKLKSLSEEVPLPSSPCSASLMHIREQGA